MFLSQRFFYETQSTEGGGSDPIKTKEQIDRQNEFRVSQNMEPIAYPEGMVDETPNDNGLTTEQREAAEKLVRAEADKIKKEQEDAEKAAREEAGKNGTTPVIKITGKAAATPKNTPEHQDEDIEDEILLKQLSKKAGREITSLEDFINPPKAPTEAEKEASEQQRENNKLKFAIDKNIISKKEIESFIEDTKNPQKLVYDYFSAQQKKIDSELTEAEIKENFEDTFGIGEKEESLKFKQGQQQMDFIATSIINQKHASYLSLDNQFDAFEKSESNRSEQNKQVLAKASVYKKDVQEAAQSVSQQFAIAGYNIELDAEVLKPFVDAMLDNGEAERQIKGGYTKENLQSTLRSAALIENLESVVNGILEQDRLKHQAGTRGVPPKKNIENRDILGGAQSEERKKLQERLGMPVN